jgi:DnaK suppressor protein
LERTAGQASQDKQVSEFQVGAERRLLEIKGNVSTMTETDMTETELNKFRGNLENIRTELEERNCGRAALAIERSPDELDRIQESQERESALHTLDRNSKALRQVNDALNRIQAGGFGVCVECEAAINPKRLAAIPWVSTCIVCQESADREKSSWNESELPLVLAA